uniref:KAP NTPase domain-containing protein n=1 Tax=Acrobeloides nanus TaxID=290746 RepID=A0A914DMY8_9BILA
MHLQENDLTINLSSPFSDEAISPQIAAYFEDVEAGRMPVFANLNPIAISTLRNANAETLLIAAARCGHTEIVSHLLPDGDVEETDNDGWTALLNAAKNGHREVVKLLLDAGATVDQTDLMGWSPLMWAAYKNRLGVVDELIAAKAHINLVGEEDSLTPLIIASGRGYIDIVRALIQAGAQVNACDKFGSTALIWASRKGYLEIVEELLNAGAELDAIGMYSSTALMLATKNNYFEVVEALLKREPNVNVVDYNGLSALGIASREGYTKIAEELIHAGAFVNLADRYGNSILASAVRSGNINIVRMLLDKYADVNAKDCENRTPLHLAIDKSYMEIVLCLLEKKPNLELRNKEGDTALLRAVKNRDVAMCQLLVNAGAKLSATDNSGDNSLHLALRSRSPRLTQVLLVNPSDSKLLYRPNRLGETPYSIDQENPHPILPSIFGPIGADVDLKNMLGYDVYGDVLADIVCEPNLSLPLTIGLYAKWGSGKSLLLPKMRDSMKSFSRSWLDGVELYWSWSLIFTLLVICGIFMLILATILAANFAKFTNEITYVPVVVGTSIYAALISLYAFIYYGSEVKLWNTSITVARLIARALTRFKLVLSIFTLNAPVRTDKDLVVSPVSFLFADDHRISFIGGEQALTNIVHSLFVAAEDHYGTFAVRLFSAFKAPHQHTDAKLRTLCGIPVLVYAAVMLLSLILSLFLLIFHFKMREVDLLVTLIHGLDAFTNSQTRLVIMIDGLDSCEQNKMVQILDALSLFFSSRQNSPFIVILAVDPHIIISAINHNLKGASSNSEITGYDYIKNIVSMPFYLHQAAVKKLLISLRQRSETVADWKERTLRSETFRESRVSLRDHKDHMERTFVANDFGHLFPSNDYFSNMNPRTMKRIVNSIALSGRLLRTFEVEFSWYLLYSWISLIEQWPYRMTWLIDRASDVQDDNTLLSELYYRVKQQLPIDNGLLDLDRNPNDFEVILRKMGSSRNEQLTIGHVKQFSACTSNLDPYLRKLIKQYRKEQEGMGEDVEGALIANKPRGAAEFLFDDLNIWESVKKPLVKMQIDEVVYFVNNLNISEIRMKKIIPNFYENNLNGLVLQSCNLDELRESLNVSLGDWTLIRLLIETLRQWKPPQASSQQRRSISGPSGLYPALSGSKIAVNNIPLSRAPSSTQASQPHTNLVMTPPIEDIIAPLSPLPDEVASNKNLSSIKEEDVVDSGPNINVDIDLLDRDDEIGSDGDSARSIAGSRENLLVDSSSTELINNL